MNTTIELKRDTTCPPWCEGHGGSWLPWELEAGTRQPIRTHASPSFGDAHLTENFVTVQLEIEERIASIGAPEIVVYSDLSRLTADEARRLAKALTEAASVLEDAQAVTR